jgi:hypothetical protein
VHSVCGTYGVEYYAYHQAAAGAARNVLAVAHVGDGDLEAVAAGARVVIDLERLIVEAVFDLDLVVEVVHDALGVGWRMFNCGQIISMFRAWWR